MVKVIYSIDDDMITYLNVSGHANSADKGEDLICAAISSIMFGLMNAIDLLEIDDVDIIDAGNKIEIINKTKDMRLNDYLSLAMIQLKTIEESYKQYINIKRKELS